MRELELATADAVAAEAGHGVAAKPSHTRTECPNCGAHLYGRYCQDCGQSADDHHRSIWHLLWEAVEGFTHLDGRLAKTLPALLFHPGALARDHIEGRRQRHVPPFRLFLITLLTFMFTAELMVGYGGHASTVKTSTARAHGSYQLGNAKVVVYHGVAARAVIEKDPDVQKSPLARWLIDRIGRASANREYYLMLVFEWAHRLAVLLLPILAGLLTLFYVYRKKLYVYDHLVVSMQYLSFCFLLWGVVWLVPDPVQGWLFLLALIWTPFNLYLILRTAYGSSRIGAGVKALVLWSTTVCVFGVLLVGLLAYALNQM